MDERSAAELCSHSAMTFDNGFVLAAVADPPRCLWPGRKARC